MAHIFMRPRDRHGQLRIKHKPRGKPITYKEEFWEYWKKYDIPDWRIQQLYDETIRKHQKALADAKGNSTGRH